MSSTIVLKVIPGVGTEELEELRNSWGSAVPVWQKMADMYCPPFDPAKEGYGRYNNWDDSWPLFQRTDIPKAYRAVLGLTFDRAYVLKKNFERLSADISKFLKDFPWEPRHVNHWPRIAAICLTCDAPAIGLRCTTVSQNTFRGPWNEETETYDPLDWSTAFEVYEDLDAMDSRKDAEVRELREKLNTACSGKSMLDWRAS